MSRRCPEGVKGTIQIHGHDTPPLISAHLNKGFLAAATNTSIGKTSVDFSHLRKAFGKDLFNFRFLGNITLKSAQLASARCELGKCFCVFFRISSPNHHIGSRLCHRLCHAQTDARVSPSNQSDLAGQIKCFVSTHLLRILSRASIMAKNSKS